MGDLEVWLLGSRIVETNDIVSCTTLESRQDCCWNTKVVRPHNDP